MNVYFPYDGIEHTERQKSKDVTMVLVVVVVVFVVAAVVASTTMISFRFRSISFCSIAKPFSQHTHTQSASSSCFL